MQVRLHMMCAEHPNIVQILEVYANSVQFPHESSPRCVSCEILSTVWRFPLCPLPIPLITFVFNRARLLIVMEMMEGGELFHRISQHRHFTEKMASQVTKQVKPRGSSRRNSMRAYTHRQVLSMRVPSTDQSSFGTLSLPESCTSWPEARESALQGQLAGGHLNFCWLVFCSN